MGKSLTSSATTPVHLALAACALAPRVPAMSKRALPVVASAAADAANQRGRAAGLKAVKAAKERGIEVSNSGAGVMPVGAAAPYNGERYTLLSDAPDAPPPTLAPAHDGARDAAGRLVPFAACREDFRPTFTPAECIAKGIFGGCYFNPRGGKPGLFGREVAVGVEEFPASWFEGVGEGLYASRRYHVPTNRYGVKAGQDQAFWEGKGWIHEQDPRGWFQWYCRFFVGRRTADDDRQQQRWLACAGGKGRWRNQLCGRVRTAGAAFDDEAVSPVIRQTLLHWAYELSEADYAAWRERQKAK